MDSDPEKLTLKLVFVGGPFCGKHMEFLVPLGDDGPAYIPGSMGLASRKGELQVALPCEMQDALAGFQWDKLDIYEISSHDWSETTGWIGDDLYEGARVLYTHDCVRRNRT